MLRRLWGLQILLVGMKISEATVAINMEVPLKIQTISVTCMYPKGSKSVSHKCLHKCVH